MKTPQQRAAQQGGTDLSSPHTHHPQAVSRDVLSAIGGTLWIERKGTGASFAFRLPLWRERFDDGGGGGEPRRSLSTAAPGDLANNNPKRGILKVESSFQAPPATHNGRGAATAAAAAGRLPLEQRGDMPTYAVVRRPLVTEEDDDATNTMVPGSPATHGGPRAAAAARLPPPPPPRSHDSDLTDEIRSLSSSGGAALLVASGGAAAPSFSGGSLSADMRGGGGYGLLAASGSGWTPAALSSSAAAAAAERKYAAPAPAVAELLSAAAALSPTSSSSAAGGSSVGGGPASSALSVLSERDGARALRALVASRNDLLRRSIRVMLDTYGVGDCECVDNGLVVTNRVFQDPMAFDIVIVDERVVRSSFLLFASLCLRSASTAACGWVGG